LPHLPFWLIGLYGVGVGSLSLSQRVELGRTMVDHVEG
jgi:hypothetical protein